MSSALGSDVGGATPATSHVALPGEATEGTAQGEASVNADPGVPTKRKRRFVGKSRKGKTAAGTVARVTGGGRRAVSAHVNWTS